MNWRHETWRKLYCREEGSFAALSYSARALAAMLLKQVDDRGRIYARAGEDLTDALCFRMGATRGERRQIRKALAELVGDGYLVQGEGWLRIKNFHHAQGRVEVVDLTGPEPVTTEPPSCTDDAPNVSRPGLEAVATVSRPSTEDRVNDSESFSSPSVVPSVPFLPSVPAVEEEGAARARDPMPLAPATEPELWRSGYQWCEAFRAAWTNRYGRFYGNGGDGRWWRTLQDEVLERMPEEEGRQLWERRLELFARYFAVTDERVAAAKHPFSFLVVRFTDLRPDLVAPSDSKGRTGGGIECSFHRGGRNQGKRTKVSFRADCPECKHLSARAGPRPAAAPEGIGELIEGYTQQQNGR